MIFVLKIRAEAEAYSLWPSSPDQIAVVQVKPPNLSYPPTHQTLNSWNFVTPQTPINSIKVIGIIALFLLLW